MKAITIKQAEKNEIDWINTKYEEVDFTKSNDESEYIVIAKIGDENAGLGRLVKINDNHIELGGIYVFPNYRGLGVAENIVRTLCEENPFEASTCMWCLPFENLLGFYAKFGFNNALDTTPPEQVAKKLEWCNSNNRYEKKVLLLCKKNKTPV
ncbi:GNAT family N-acetyltransferase [Zunongwangia pacifica]|uniref:GNAT family N-acetyltransferase n=1 Tax=Zunongwangia pacifica TaxID=2911062 RepID=A0A9X1ZXL1_9FLAO|nr:GNAT family N-acetyltransferase [Zunongwangia pacifica]MCL6220408.1 GNAT family N-acetyltransferase [Zunongwangia pacifica]